jgi:FAD:protein FMN transferase
MPTRCTNTGTAVLRTSPKLVPFFLAASLLAADRYRASEPHMGTLVTITLYADSAEQAQRGFIAAFARIEALNGILSDYRPDSELSRVCEIATLSPELITVLTHAQRLAKETGGAFDITAGPLSRLWRKARAEKRLPADGALTDALRRSGYRKLKVSEDAGTAQCLVPAMQLDAGGIAKGYAADEAVAALRKIGIHSALVAISGDIAVGDAPPGEMGWRIHVQGQTVTLSNAGVSTSGNEFQFVEIDGIRYSHIFDPRTGKALRNSDSVSVVANSGMEADALATAISVLNSEGHRGRGPIVDIRTCAMM